MRGQRPYAPKIPVPLGVVEPIADDELIGDIESDVPGFDVHLDGVWFAQQRENLERCRLARPKVLQQPRQGETGIENVFNDQDVSTLNVPVKILQNPNTPLLVVPDPYDDTAIQSMLA